MANLPCSADGPSAPNPKKPVAFFVALGLFALTNLGIAAFSSTYQPDISKAVFAWSENDQHTKPWSWWLARKWLEQKQAPDVVLFGSSQMGSAMAASDAKHLFEVVDALTHRRAATLESELNSRLGRKYSAFSLASPGAMCSDAFMASSALFREDFKPKVVVIGISPRDFIDNTMAYPAVTEPFKFYSNYVNTGSLTLHSYAGPMAWLQFGMESLPCRKLGTRIQTELAAANQAGEQNSEPSKVDTALAAIMGGGEAVPGKWRVPAVIPPMWQDNTKEYVRRFKNPRPGVYTAEKAFFAQFLAKMERDDIKVLVVGMPSLPMNRALLPDSFWNEFRASIGTMAHLHGAQFLDLTASNEFGKEDFLDTVHLDASGGEKLFAAIAKSIETEPTLCNSLTGRNELAIKAKPSKTQ